MVIGHKKQRDFLKGMVGSDHIAHAYLFAGPEKLGKKKVAVEWASLILDKNLEKENHPDFIFIGASEEQKEIQIAQIRELMWKLSLKPYSASSKVAVIDDAHLMNFEAQSSLLKTLEEPKGNTILILITDHPSSLLPTIASRAEMIKFYPVGSKEINAYFKKENIPEKDVEDILSFSFGKPGLVIDLAKNSGYLKKYRQKIKDIERLSSANLADRFQYAKDISEDAKEIKDTLDIWLVYFRKLLIQSKAGMPFSKLKEIIKQIQSTDYLLSKTNVNSKLALEILMLTF